MTVQGNETARASLDLLYHISRELTTALDLGMVLQSVLSLSMENVGAISGSLIVMDGQGLPVESVIIINNQVHTHTTEQLKETFERGLAGWVAHNKLAVLIPDTSQDSRWLQRPDDAADQTGPKSAVSAPILVRDQLIGVINLVHPTPGFFTQEHLFLVQTIADQAGIAVLNARLYEESQRQARVMTAVAESAAVITGSLNEADVLQRILEQISQALRVEAVSLALIDYQTQELEFRASTSSTKERLIGLRLPLGQGVAGWVAREGRGALVQDAYHDPRFQSPVDHSLGFETRPLLCVPIHSQGQVIGVIEAVNPLDGTFDADALSVLTGISSLAGTAIRHAQLFEQLEAAHQRYRELFEDSIDPILVTDWNGRILEENRQAELTIGLGSDPLKRRNIQELEVVDPKQVGENYEKLKAGAMISYEARLQTAGGHNIPVQVYARQFLMEGTSNLQWILRDITERKNLDDLREDLISMIYHDLRSPLANIVSSLDVLASLIPEENEDTVASLLNIAVKSTERIQRLTNSLLDINRLEAGQSVGNRLAIQPAALVKEACEAVWPAAENKQTLLSLAISEELPKISVDPDMIRRVLINLMENAVKYTPPGSKIFISADPVDQLVQFSIKDNGPGIPPAEHARIFDKFTRLEAKDGPRGLGLGLAFCRLAILGHGGQIWVESEPGTGTNFIFTLPIAENGIVDPDAVNIGGAMHDGDNYQGI